MSIFASWHMDSLQWVRLLQWSLYRQARRPGVCESLPFTGRVAPRSGVGWGDIQLIWCVKNPHPAVSAKFTQAA